MILALVVLFVVPHLEPILYFFWKYKLIPPTSVLEFFGALHTTGIPPTYILSLYKAREKIKSEKAYAFLI